MIPLYGKPTIITNDEIIVIYRRKDIVWKDGRPVWNNELALKFRGNVQPMMAKDLLLVPEGDRLKEQLWVWTNNDGKCGAGNSIEVNDMMVRLNVNYQVQSTENWGSYTRSRMMRIDVGPDRTPGEQAIN